MHKEQFKLIAPTQSSRLLHTIPTKFTVLTFKAMLVS